MRSFPLIVLVSLVLASCTKADPGESGPDEELLKARLSTELPAYISLRSVRVQASQNVGDKVEPLFKTRFTATIELVADTFLQSSVEEGAVIVVPHLKRGITRELYGLASSALSSGSWKTVFAYDNNPIPTLGRPRDFFTGGLVVVRGSAEETAFRDGLRKKRAEEEQQQLEASQREVERIRMESQIQAERLRAAAQAQAEQSRAQEQIKAELAERTRQEAEARLRSWIKPNSSFSGKSGQSYYEKDAQIHIESVDNATKSVSGRIVYDSVGAGSLRVQATFRFNGQWSGGTITATGVETYTGGSGRDRPRDCSLTLTVQASGRLEGALCGQELSFVRGF